MENDTSSAAPSRAQPEPQGPPAAAKAGAPRSGRPADAAASKPFSISVHKSASASVQFFSKGVQLISPKQLTKSKGNVGGKRGNVTKWSPASRARLRDFLLRVGLPEGWQDYAVTLTVPGPILSAADWRRIFKRWCDRVQRSGCAMVWRVELQQRKQPHIHAILWGPVEKVLRRLGTEAWPECIELLGPCEHVTAKGKTVKASTRMWLPGAMLHAVTTSKNDGSSNWWRYLCDHTSKAKSAQMGWEGRQWGKVGCRRLFVSKPHATARLSERARYRLIRWLRKLTKAQSPYRFRYGTSTLFTNPETVRRLVELARASDHTVLHRDATV